MERTTEQLDSGSAGIARAAQLLSQGGLVAFPTETVYGLGADARQDSAVAGIYSAKNRPGFNPLIVHVADIDTVQHYGEFNDTAMRLAQAFWPGPMSLVLPLKAGHGLSELVTAGLGTVAIRVPAHALGQALLRAFGGPVAAPSANLSGAVSPTTAAHVLDGLGGRIDAVLMGENCEVGLESTILAAEGETVSLLRAGGLPVEIIESCLGRPLRYPQDSATPRSPGQLQSHYAPVAAIRLNATRVKDNEVLLGFGNCDNATLNLSRARDLTEAAANLFACLRRIDQIATDEGKTIAVSPVPAHGLGLAINDRLTRGAAARA